MTAPWLERSGEAFGRFLTRSERRIDQRLVDLIAAASNLESAYEALDTPDVIVQAARLGVTGPVLMAGLPERVTSWAAAMREVARRSVDLRPHDVQLIAALRMLGCEVIEMGTGEGKTLVGALAAATFALGGRGVHVLSVNDYLARRDAQWMAPLYTSLGVSVDAVTAHATQPMRRRAYGAQVTYVAVSEVGFDILRDRQAESPADLVLSGTDIAVIDEADSVMVDEARVPLVLAAARESDAVERVSAAATAVATMTPELHFTSDEEGLNVHLTPVGEQVVEAALGGVDLYGPQGWMPVISAALHAHALVKRDVHYVVQDNEVRLVNLGRGRVATRQRWPDGLHAAVEAKEGLPITRGAQIIDTITIQGLLNRYQHLCGMTGTALAAVVQIRSFYEARVSVVPPNRPVRRQDLPDRIFQTCEAKYAAIIAQVENDHATGRPVLVCTLSVAESEMLADRLCRRGVRCLVLNAKNDEAEARVIAEAGRPGAVTISTQMAGRGTDIRLGGPDEADRDIVVALGGLSVIGTGHHASSRLDDQLRGRAGRQGDPGTTIFFASLEDAQVASFGDLTRLHVNPKLGGELDDPHACRAIDHAQRVEEGATLEIHANSWQYSRIIEHQRRTVDMIRDGVLHGRPGMDGHSELASRTPERYRELRSELSQEALDVTVRMLLLYQLDRYWSEHLEHLADLREGIHLRALAGKNPLAEFNRDATRAFDQFIARTYDQAAELLESATVTADGIDVVASGISRPTATWTYMIHDDPFGTGIDRILRRLHNALNRRRRHWKRR